LYRLKKRLFQYEPLLTKNIPHEGFKDHVIIAGGGRVGQHIAQVLTKLEIPFVIIELNHQRMVECQQAKFPVIYGDMSQPAALEVSNVTTARLLLITTPLAVTTQTIVKQALVLKPELQIIARAEGVAPTQELYKMGVYMVVLPEMETGLEIARQALVHLEIPVTAIQQYIDGVRRQLYAPIFNASQDQQLLTKLDNIKEMLEISWVQLGASSPFVNKTIKETAVRTRTGASIVGFLRQGIFHPNPGADVSFQPEDMVAIVGNQQERSNFKKLSG
jgi:CPA2 family monovalent cation:H+ antiporter-2